MKNIKYLVKKIVHPYGKTHFLLEYIGKRRVTILDIGCGNNSVNVIKKYCPNCYYIGIDICDYNLGIAAKCKMDEYHIVEAEAFADKIDKFRSSIDVVISSHNIEHCNEPQKVLKNMISSLRKGGAIYMSFPSEDSVNFPKRLGTLNFYDDPTHIWCPEWDNIIKIMKENNIQIEYLCKNYSPFILKTIGGLNERKSKREGKVLKGTWAYYGFESVIWGTRIV